MISKTIGFRGLAYWDNDQQTIFHRDNDHENHWVWGYTIFRHTRGRICRCKRCCWCSLLRTGGVVPEFPMSQCHVQLGMCETPPKRKIIRFFCLEVFEISWSHLESLEVIVDILSGNWRILLRTCLEFRFKTSPTSAQINSVVLHWKYFH